MAGRAAGPKVYPRRLADGSLLERVLGELSMGKPVCRHCLRRVGGRARGLCWACSSDASIRALYPSTSKFGVRGITRGNSRLPEPTGAPPGTEAKIVVLTQRAARGEALFHPLDYPGGLSCA